jgi:3-oxoacyl-[acyl-carrier-protein] synthase II
MGSKRIVITDVNILSCLGMGFDSLASGLSARPPVASVKDYEFHQFDREISCFLVRGFDPVAVLGKKGLRTKDNATKMLLGTLDGFKTVMEGTDEQGRPGICIGTAFGSVQSIGDFLSDSIVNGVNNVNPQAFANTVINSPTGNANIRYLARNLSATIATGFNAGIDAIIYAADHIECGYLDRIVAGGLEEVSYYSLLGMQRTGILSGGSVVRPFAADTDGCIMGEACALFLLETETAARERGATIVAEIAGYASGFDPDAARDGLSDGNTGAHVIREACTMAKVTPSQIGFVASCANGTPTADRLEAKAITSALGCGIPVTAYKTFTGECYGASGAVAVMCALSDMKNQRISGTGPAYPTINPIPLVFETAHRESDYSLVTSLSCEGNCSAIILKNIH